jgi:hypothetical protein
MTSRRIAVLLFDGETWELLTTRYARTARELGAPTRR